MTVQASPSIERTLPHSLEAERSVLGAILMRNEGLDEALERLSAGDFYRAAHRRIFTSMVALRERQEPIDLVTIREAMKAAGTLDEAGGPAYMARLVDGVPRSTNVAHYAGIVRDKARRRRLIHEALAIADAAFDDGDLSADEVLNDAEARIFRMSQEDQRTDLVGGADLIQEVMPMLEALLRGERRGVTGLSTGFVDLDGFTQGLQPGELIVIAARPSIGKSSLVSDICRHVAIELQQVAGFFSVEMSRRMTTIRNIIAQGRVDGLRLRSGHVSPNDYDRVMQAAYAIENSKLFIDDCTNLRPMELRSKARRLKALFGLALLAVDYMQLMKGDRGERFENRQIEVASISRSLKGIAKELDVPVIAICQLGRKVEERSDKRPTMADLRESGAIEQDADVVGLIHRPGQYDPEADQGYAELIIAKQRNNPTGVVKLTWLPYASRFENYTEGAA